MKFTMATAKDAVDQSNVRPMEDRQQIGARVKTEVYRQLKILAVHRGETVQSLVEEAIESYLLAKHAD